MSIKDRGFATMVRTEEGRQRQQKIASQGGKEGHRQGVAHEWTPEEARLAGRKGGMAFHAPRRKKEASHVG